MANLTPQETAIIRDIASGKLDIDSYIEDKNNGRWEDNPNVDTELIKQVLKAKNLFPSDIKEFIGHSDVAPLTGMIVGSNIGGKVGSTIGGIGGPVGRGLGYLAGSALGNAGGTVIGEAGKQMARDEKPNLMKIAKEKAPIAMKSDLLAQVASQGIINPLASLVSVGTKHLLAGATQSPYKAIERWAQNPLKIGRMKGPKTVDYPSGDTSRVQLETGKKILAGVEKYGEQEKALAQKGVENLRFVKDTVKVDDIADDLVARVQASQAGTKLGIPAQSIKGTAKNMLQKAGIESTALTPTISGAEEKVLNELQDVLANNKNLSARDTKVIIDWIDNHIATFKVNKVANTDVTQGILKRTGELLSKRLKAAAPEYMKSAERSKQAIITQDRLRDLLFDDKSYDASSQVGAKAESFVKNFGDRGSTQADQILLERVNDSLKGAPETQNMWQRLWRFSTGGGKIETPKFMEELKNAAAKYQVTKSSTSLSKGATSLMTDVALPLGPTIKTTYRALMATLPRTLSKYAYPMAEAYAREIASKGKRKLENNKYTGPVIKKVEKSLPFLK